MLRDYQYDIEERVVNSNARNVLAVMPTGAGKTVVMSNILKRLNVPSISIAHRQELVGQISMAMARTGIEHNIIAPDAVVRFIIQMHHKELGKSMYRADAHIAAAGVDTLIRRKDVEQWGSRVELWEIDEAHHVVPGNKWGKAVEMFPNARGIGWTATPQRTDGKALGDTFQEMVVGPTMRELISRGFLTDYRIFGPGVQMDRGALKIGNTGDYTQSSLAAATDRADITGDIIEQYIKHASGKRGVTFAASVNLSKQYAEAYRASGVPAAHVDAKTPDRERAEMIAGLRSGELLQLTNVDLFGEGFDLPAIECISMGRATMSYGLYAQMFGRVLRPFEGKSHGIVIDHVGNVMEHGLPDRTQNWSLGVTPPGTYEAPGIPIRQCLNPACLAVFESWTKECPECGQRPMIEGGASEPKQVEGDLTEYSPELLAQLRGEAARAVAPPYAGLPKYIQDNMEKRATEQYALRDQIANYAGYWRDVHNGQDHEIYIRFNREFGIDIATAQTLKYKEAQTLRAKIIFSLMSA